VSVKTLQTKVFPLRPIFPFRATLSTCDLTDPTDSLKTETVEYCPGFKANETPSTVKTKKNRWLRIEWQKAD
jgi:hypothetical protein